ncbi:UNVERIFIED_CONTAM: C45 family peptidase [Microbacterium sp. SLM126]
MMIIHRYESTTRDAHVRGEEIGTRFRPQIEESLEGYWRLFDAKGVPRDEAEQAANRILEAVADWSPGLATEMSGLAAGAGLEPWEAALMSGRTEIIALANPSGHGECSTGVHLPADGSAPRTLQTWDWYTHLASESLAWSYVSDSGRRVHSFTELGILGKVGINDAGVGSHMNLLNHAADGSVTGIPLHLIARRIHDEATTFDEAVEIVRSARIGASSTLTVAAYDGTRARAAFVESTPVGVAVLEGAPGETMRHTNHFLDPELAHGEQNPDMSDTHGRLAALDERAYAFALPEPADRAAQLVEGLPGGGPVCISYMDEEIPELSCETKATLSLDFERGVLHYRSGAPVDGPAGGWETI